jgi:Tol biopolymer transport system component
MGARWTSGGRGRRKGIQMWDLDADGLTGRNQRSIVDVGDQLLRCYAISPDGRSVAWIARGGDNPVKATLNITVISTGATRLVAELQSQEPVDVVTWTPNGRHIVFADTTAPTTIAGTEYKQSELWRVPVAGGKPEKLGLTLDHIVFPAYSPDGRFLAFTAMHAGPGGLFVIDKLLPPTSLR